MTIVKCLDCPLMIEKRGARIRCDPCGVAEIKRYNREHHRKRTALTSHARVVVEANRSRPINRVKPSRKEDFTLFHLQPLPAEKFIQMVGRMEATR